MKALSYLLALASVPAFVAQAADKAGSLGAYFPTDGNLKQGALVGLVQTDGFRQLFLEPLQKAPKETRDAYTRELIEKTLEQQPAYNADIWPDKADYDKMIVEWRKLVRPTSLVAIGLQEVREGIWRVLSATPDSKTKQSIPLTVSSLRYDSNRNVWISNNGELTAKPYSASESSIFGAQTGTEWTLEKTDSLAKLRETVCVTKTTDGKFIYLTYKFDEQSAVTGANIANGQYRLMFPVQTAGANLGTPGQR